MGFRMLTWPLVEEAASSKGVGQDTLTRIGRAVGVMLYRQGWGGENSYLGLWILVWLLVECKAFARCVVRDQVARRGGACSVMMAGQVVWWGT